MVEFAPEKQKQDQKHPKKDRVVEVANTFEWLITAFILAFVFRAFVMEAFRIPTGSMADTLKGAHFRLRCPQCGYKYEYGYIPQLYRQQQDTIPAGPVQISSTRCPVCGYFPEKGSFDNAWLPVANGDRILVLKCIYQFFEPKRWDVVVFKNPIDPNENYIKRLVGLPNEQLEIIDGDLYVNGKIVRKPYKVQEELWMPIYDNDYQPVLPNERAFNGHKWEIPFNFSDRYWQIDKDRATRLILNCPSDKISKFAYYQANGSANDFKTTYAYNDTFYYGGMPVCSDLMVRFYINPSDEEGKIGAILRKYGIDYKAWLDINGSLSISMAEAGGEKILISSDIKPVKSGKFTLFKFANVDHQLLLEVGGDKLAFDLGNLPDSIKGDRNISPKVEVFGSGKLTLAHFALFRDIYYTSKNPQPSKKGRVVEGSPFQLKEDEFFVLGDNSPNSEDGRWWPDTDKASRGMEPPRAGVVPRYYLVGKAVFVYWPSGFEFPWPKGVKDMFQKSSNKNLLSKIAYTIITLRWIPDIGQMRFLYGGTNEKPADSS